MNQRTKTLIKQLDYMAKAIYYPSTTNHAAEIAPIMPEYSRKYRKAETWTRI